MLSQGFDENRRTDSQDMGHVLVWSRRVDLAGMTPHGELASSKYCLANPGVEYLVCCPAGSKTINVTLPAGRFAVLWFDAAEAKRPRNPRYARRRRTKFAVPIAGDALLHLQIME